MPAERPIFRQRLAAAAAFALLAGGSLLAGAPASAAAPTTPAPTPAPAADNGLARTPQMGFNNWNSTHCRADFNEAMVKGIADTLRLEGLKDAGYQYVNIDDCWALPNRDATGNLVPDPVRFPHGIKAVADYVHAKGLKFGIYTSAGTKTCDARDSRAGSAMSSRTRTCSPPGAWTTSSTTTATTRAWTPSSATRPCGRAPGHRAPDRLQHLRMGREPALGLGR